MTNRYFDFDPIADGSWNQAPFESDYVIPKRKSKMVDPYELLPDFPEINSSPDAAPPKAKTRALAGLDDFGSEPDGVTKLAIRATDYGLTQPIAAE